MASALALCLALFSGIACAYSDAAAELYFSSIERITRYSPLEHAGSHGTLGINLGVGAGSYVLNGDDEILQAHWRANGANQAENETPNGRIYIPRVFFHKGLPWSLDVGFAYGLHAATKATLAGAYMQWTAFEGFALPSIGVRGSLGRLMGLQTTDASMVNTDLLVSYGFMRIFTVYGGLGAGRSQIKVRSGDEYGTSLSLTGSSDNSSNRVGVVQTQLLGLQVQILPPFVGLTLESQKTGSGPSSYLGKLSVGM